MQTSWGLPKNLIIRFLLEENRAGKARVEPARNRDHYGRKIYRII